jgi:lipopolysaccharide export system protein LptA
VVHRLTARGDTWTYQGDVTRSTVESSDGHRVQTVLHERTDDGTTYRPSSRVTLVKVG